MIITLTRADFSSCKIGTLTTFNVRKSTVIGASVNIIKTSVERAGYSSATTIATIVLDEANYEGHAIKVMMGSTDVSSWYSLGNVIVPANTPITSNITISVSATAVAPDVPVTPDEPDTPTTYTFTINPTPSDATVKLIVDENVQITKVISVPKNTKVSYSVSKDGYITVNSSYVVTSDKTIDVELEIADVDIEYVTDVPYTVNEFKQGSYSQGGLSAESGRIRAGYFNAIDKELHLTLNGAWYGYVCYQSETNHPLIGSQSWTQSEVFRIPSKAQKLLIVLKNDDNNNITPSDYIDGESGSIVFQNPPEKEIVETYDASYFVRGGLTTSTSSTNTSEQNRVRTDLLDCVQGDTIQVTLPQGMICYVAYKSTSDTSMKFSSWSNAGEVVKVDIPYTGQFCVVVAYSDKTTKFKSDASDFTGHVDVLRLK